VSIWAMRSAGGQDREAVVRVSYKHRRCHLSRTLAGMMCNIDKYTQHMQ
jgi:hypothetical protein